MADNKKIYTIQINGIEQSINAVEALNAKLNELDAKIKKLDESKVSVSSSSPTSTSRSSGNASSLSEEAALQKEINKLKSEGATLDAKIAAAQDEVYRKVDATKQLYKETIADQKALAAQERLVANTYSNTMQGMKSKLADLKSVINTTDLGDSDQIKKMTQEYGELTSKLKEMEEAYGQFGNYANGVAEGMKNLTIQVGDSTKEFDNAKQALKELKKERDTLAVKKDMGLISEEEAKRLEELIPTVAQLQSAIQDAGKPMDALMDSMQSVVALAQTGKGFAAFFGIDDDEIERSIQKLVALQNAMQGLQTIQKQLQSGEGIGQWLAKGNESIDKLVNSIFGVEKASKAATVASKALGTALKGIGIGALVAGIIELISLLEKWSNKQKKVAEEAEEAAEKVRKAVDDQRQAYISASVQYENTASRLSHLRSEYLTTNDALRKTSILKEASKEFKNLGMSVKSVTDAQNILVNQGDKVIELIRLQGDAAALAALRMEAFKKSFSQILENNGDVNYARILASNGGLVKALDEQLDEVNQKIGKFQKELGIKTKETGSKQGKTIQEIEKELTRIRIDQMKEGLNKTLKQLEEERRQKIAKIRADGKMVGELELETNKLYDKKIEDAKKKHAENVEKIYNDMWKNIQDQTISNAKKELEMFEEHTEYLKGVSERQIRSHQRNLGSGSYGIQGKEQLSKSTQETLGIESTKKSKLMTDMKEYIDLLRKANTAQIELLTANSKFKSNTNLSDEELGKLNMEIDKLNSEQKKLTKSLSAKEKELKKLYGDELFDKTREKLLAESYSSSLSGQIEQRLALTEWYWTERIRIEEQGAKRAYDKEIKFENDNYKKISGETLDKYDKLLRQASDYYSKRMELVEAYEASGNTSDANLERKEAEAEYKKAADTIKKEREKQEELDQEEHENNLLKIEQKRLDKSKNLNAEYYKDIIQEMRDAQTAIADLESKQPVKNAWGFTNWKKTDANNNNLLNAYTKLATKIDKKRLELQAKFEDGLITKDAYNSTLREFDALAVGIGEKMDKVKEEMSFSNKFGTIIQEAQQYINAIGNALTTVLNAVWDAQDYQFEKAQDALDKWSDELDKALGKQEKIVEEHKSNIESIEQELANARGDRRQHLIDQLNAEMAAQREELREQKRIEKEKEKLVQKQEELEKKRREEEYKRNVMQAFISWHLGVANALATQPFLPLGIAMGAMATALGAVQYALVKSQKPYAKGGQLDGGVAQGNRHRDGGIKVLGGHAEIEGGEFITNRLTTSKNVDLLEYINSKKKRINISDLIDFYGGNSQVKKSISTVRTKFADGGVVPTLRTDINLSDRLLTAFEDYSNRPTVVSVVDIIDRTQTVNEVKTMAGLDV